LYYFICENKDGLPNIIQAADDFNLKPWRLKVLPAYDKAKDLRAWKEAQNMEGVLVACGERAARVVFDDYQAKLNKYRRLKEANRRCLSDPSKRKEFFKDLSSGHVVGRLRGFPIGKAVVIDIETNGLNPWAEDAKILSISISTSSNSYAIVTLSELQDWLALVQPELIIGHNLKFDMVWLAKFGIDISQYPIYDTMVVEHLTDENRPKSLESLIFRYTGFPNYWSNIDVTKLEEAELGLVHRYNGWDTAATFAVWEKQKFDKSALFNYEMGKLKALAKVELSGMKVDRDLLTKKMKEAEGEVFLANEEIRKEVPKLNPNSGQQIGKHLYEKLGIQPRWTDKGKYRTDNETLEIIQKEHNVPFLNSIISLRQYSKLLSTYYENINKFCDRDNFLHGNFNQAQVVTGRLSSSGTINFQNIPARNSQSVESLFCSRYNNGKIVKIDFSQMELRLLADLSHDKNMLEAFKKGEDFHEATAKNLGISRADAKTINFKIVYGGGTKEQEDAWFRSYPEAKKWREQTINYYKRYGHVKSPLGRIRHVKQSYKESFKEKLHKERQSHNSIIQGMASDLTMIALQLILAKPYNCINTIHDSIILDQPASFDVFDEEIIRNICEKEVSVYLKQHFGYQMEVPLRVDISIGFNWGECA